MRPLACGCRLYGPTESTDGRGIKNGENIPESVVHNQTLR